jgi:hypothetical protein
MPGFERTYADGDGILSARLNQPFGLACEPLRFHPADVTGSSGTNEREQVEGTGLDVRPRAVGVKHVLGGEVDFVGGLAAFSRELVEERG